MIGWTNMADGGVNIQNNKAIIHVLAPIGSTINFLKDGITIVLKPDKSFVDLIDNYWAHWYYSVSPSNYGTWTITATRWQDTSSRNVTIDSNKQYDVGVAYFCGIKRIYNTSDPVWTREGASIDYSATASVGTAAGSSDFDSVYPWSGIERVTLNTGDVMVKIPKFAYKRFRDNDDFEHIQIATSADGDFTWHPAFLHNGVTTPQDYIYVGAYKTSSNNKSVSGASPTVNQTRATMRTNAAAKGGGWGLVDASTISAIQMLMIVEFATNDLQSVIGDGYTNADSKINTGSCNNVPNLTGRPAGTSDRVDVIWRGIEGIWGNVWEWLDGLNWNGGAYWVCNDQSRYADNTSTGYTLLGYTGATNWTSSYIKEMGYDASASAYMLPIVGGGSSSTYYCDGVWSAAGWAVTGRGGGASSVKPSGLFAQGYSLPSSAAYSNYGSRLLYIPL